MFIETNDRFINLNNVSNININESGFRVIFNMNYNIQINCGTNNTPKMISDYVYWDSLNQNQFKQKVNELSQSDFLIDNFVKKMYSEGYINVNEISSVKFLDNRKRTIFNLSHPVTFFDNRKNEKITSEFVFVDAKNENDYEDYKEYLHLELGL